MVTPRLESGLFDTVAGLPVHPLVVHVAVVLLPLAALGLIALVLVPRWRGVFGWLTMAGLVVGTGAAFVAKESGEALAARVGEPEQHAELGDVLPPVAVLLLVVAVVWFLLDRRARSTGGTAGPVVMVLGVVAALLAVGTVGLTIAVGHSGAEAVWAGEVSDSEPTTTGTGTAPTATYTLADVAAHASPSDCWTAIDGTVYDLTDWVGRHPGGAAPIESLCGTDGTTAFTTQHGTERRPNSELAGFAIGSLAAPAASALETTTVQPVATTVAPTAKRYTRAQVRRHASADDCWTIVGRGVYDVTAYVSRHPGGSARILAMCGRDATSAFTRQHGGQSRPVAELASFRIGRLAASTGA